MKGCTSWWVSYLDQSPAVLFCEDQVYAQEQLAERFAGWLKKYSQVEVTWVVTHDRPVHLKLEQSQ